MYLNLMLLITVLTSSACQTINQADLNTKTMYRSTRENLQKADFKAAAKSFPVKEQNQFITTMEKSWLGLLTGQIDTDLLLRMSQSLEDRKTIRFTYETRKFFLKELEEAYLPAEHEVIMFHIITGLAFAKNGMPQQARVEAQRASHYLQGHFGDYGGDFDDPAIRLLLAALWLYCDEWQHARVDFKVAGMLSKDLAWATGLAKRQDPPKNFILALRGVGPEVVWRPDDKDSLKWQLKFIFTEKPVPVHLINNDRPKPMALGAPLKSDHWYIRHFDRDSAPRSALDHVRHGADVAVGATAAVGLASLAIIGATIIVVGAVAASVALVAISASSKDGQLVGAALGFSANLIKATLPIALGVGTAGYTHAEGIYDRAADESEGYRYVRFLPSHYYGMPIKNLSTQAKIASENGAHSAFLNVNSKQGNRVMMFFLP